MVTQGEARARAAARGCRGARRAARAPHMMTEMVDGAGGEYGFSGPPSLHASSTESTLSPGHAGTPFASSAAEVRFVV